MKDLQRMIFAGLYTIFSARVQEIPSLSADVKRLVGEETRFQGGEGSRFQGKRTVMEYWSIGVLSANKTS